MFFAKYLPLHRDIQPFAEYAVTPCMGVWIETCRFKVADDYGVGHTLYGCVDWNVREVELCGGHQVTPCMGVWIETEMGRDTKDKVEVTPCMGVWIETGGHRHHS